jgi:hypothetical protein
MSPELSGTPHQRLLPWAESQGIDRISPLARPLQREGDVCASVYAGTRPRILGDDGRHVPTAGNANSGELRRGAQATIGERLG